MNAITIILLGVSVIYAVEAKINCDSLGVHFYEQIGCRPSTTKYDKCPNYYTCPQYPAGHDYCVFGSRMYLNGERIVGSQPCSFCTCFAGDENNKNSTGQIACAIVDCMRPIDPEPNCYQTRELNQCCATKTICPSPNNQVCKVDNKTYKEGEIFAPLGTCWLCSCRKGFQAGVYKEPNCIRRNCGLALGIKEQVQERCAPVYAKGEALCCPNDFICPEKIKNLKVKPSNQPGDSKTCVLGDLRVKYSKEIFLTYEDRYSNGIRNATCACKLPPYLTCIN